MPIYKTLRDGTFQKENGACFGENHRFYKKAMEEVESGKAEILPYKPSPSDEKKIRDNSLANITYDFGDGRVIQCRQGNFSDESNIRNAIEIMERKGIAKRQWVMADNTKADVTVSDLKQALASAQDQAEKIWDEYLATS